MEEQNEYAQMEIKNLTSQTLIITDSREGLPNAVFEKCDKPAMVFQENTIIATIQNKETGNVHDISRALYGKVVNLPEYQSHKNTIYIVTREVYEAIKDSSRTTTDLVIPGTPICDTKGNVIAYKGFAKP